MPYKSEAQRGLFHSPNSPVGPKEVEKWDRESKGQKNLPYKVKGKSAKQLFGKKKSPKA